MVVPASGGNGIMTIIRREIQYPFDLLQPQLNPKDCYMPCELEYDDEMILFTLFDDEDLLRMATILQEKHPEVYCYTPFWLRILLYRRSCELKARGLSVNARAKELSVRLGTISRWDKGQTPFKRRKPPKLVPEFGFLFGTALGDGKVDISKLRRGCALIAYKLRDQDLAEAIYEAAIKVIGGAYMYEENQWYYVGFSNAIFAELVEVAKIDYLPVIKLLQLFPREILSGLFDTEGGPTVKTKRGAKLLFSNTNKEIMKLAAELCNLINIHYGINEERRAGYIRSPTNNKLYPIRSRIIYRFHIHRCCWKRFYNEIGFKTKRKQEKLKQLINEIKFKKVC